MPVRLNRITTRSGDRGTTGLADGSRLPKHALRLEAMGTVDELNAHLGLLLAALPAETSFRDELTLLLHRLFDLGAALSLPGADRFPAEEVARLEALIEQLNADLPELQSFVLPAGSEAVARAHLARTVCRRAERCLTALAEAEPGVDGEQLLVYLNRLSDLLFVCARKLALAGGHEVLWQPAEH